MEYFISDLHFGHRNTLSFERWCFDNIETHDDVIMSALEKTTANDTLYFLGDIGYPTEEITNRLRALKCKTIMICGNHDKQSCEHYHNMYYFDEVYNHPLWLTKRIVLSHEPIPVQDGVINIHGHLHGSYIDKNNYVNVNIHMLGYKLYSMKNVMKLMGSLEKPKEGFFSEWYVGHQKLSKEQMENRKDLLYDTDGIIVGYTAWGILDHDSEKRIAINYNQLMFRTVKINDKQYTIIGINSNGLVLELVDMETGETQNIDLQYIKQIEGYGRLWKKN